MAEVPWAVQIPVIFLAGIGSALSSPRLRSGVVGTAEESVAPLYPVRRDNYGFAWGPALVQRMWHWTRKDHGKERSTFCYEIKTGRLSDLDPVVITDVKHRLHVYVSRTGRNVIVYLDGEKMVRESIVTGLLADLEKYQAEVLRLASGG